jgi:hypothetical protein
MALVPLDAKRRSASALVNPVAAPVLLIGSYFGGAETVDFDHDSLGLRSGRIKPSVALDIILMYLPNPSLT